MASEQLPAERPPRDNLVRAISGELELRDDGTKPPTLVGHFAKFDEWTEINSTFEGQFMERISPGAFKKTFQENRDRMRVLFQHGQDPQIGDKPLGAIQTLEEDRQGAYYEVPLLDAPYVRDTVLPGLKAGLYGASFRFSVQREEFNRDAKPSPHNPDGLPERTLKEIAVREFGPVTFPAYAGATAAVRSLTDDFRAGTLAAERMDSEDLSTLAQMIELGTAYIDEQDEPGDQANIPVMQSVLVTLTGLIPVEVAENEVEDELSSDGRSSAPPTDAAPVGTSSRDAAHATTTTWPTAPPDIWEEEPWNQ